MKWKQQLGILLKSTKEQLSKGHYLPLEELLTDRHDVFSLEEDKSDMVEFEKMNYPENKLPEGCHLLLIWRLQNS